MRQYLKDNNSKLIYFYMVDSTDHVTPKTGLTLTVRVSKNGSAFDAGGGSVVELETGFYAYTASVGDTDTLGPIALKATATGADTCIIEGVVVAYDPYDAVRAGLTSLPNAAANAAGGLPVSAAGGLLLDTKLENTNEITAARMAVLTDLINGGRLDLLIDAIKAKTDVIPASPAAVGSAMTLSSAYDRAKDAASYIELGSAFTPLNEKIITIDGIVDTINSLVYAIASELDSTPLNSLADKTTTTAIYDLIKESADGDVAAMKGMLTAIYSMIELVGSDWKYKTTVLANSTITAIFDLIKTSATGDVAAIKIAVDSLVTRLTAARAGYIDKLNVAGTLANTDNAASFKTAAADIITALKASTGWTVGGVWTFDKLMKVLAGWIAGTKRDKSGVSGVQEILDPDDGETVIAEITASATTPYVQVTVK